MGLLQVLRLARAPTLELGESRHTLAVALGAVLGQTAALMRTRARSTCIGLLMTSARAGYDARGHVTPHNAATLTDRHGVRTFGRAPNVETSRRSKATCPASLKKAARPEAAMKRVRSHGLGNRANTATARAATSGSAHASPSYYDVANLDEVGTRKW